MIKTKKMALVITFLMSATYSISGLAVTLPCRTSYVQDFSWRQLNRTGKVVINNRERNSVYIRLYHPDSASVFSEWTISPSIQTILSYNNQVFYVGDDWGIQINNGCIYYVGEVGIYNPNNSGAYVISLSAGRISEFGLVSPYSHSPKNYELPGNHRPKQERVLVGMGKLRGVFESALGTIAQGNNGRVSVERFNLNGNLIDFRVQIRHHQVCTDWYCPIRDIYDVTTPIQGQIDIFDPYNSLQKINFCADLPPAIGRSICVNPQQVMSIAAAIAAL